MGILTILIENISIIFELIDRCQAADVAQLPDDVQAMPSDAGLLWQLQHPGPIALRELTRAYLEDQEISPATVGRLQYRRHRRQALQEIRSECRESSVAERQEIIDQWRAQAA